VKIPKDIGERDLQYREIEDQCFASVERRRQFADLNRHFYMYGCSPDQINTAVYNKIMPTVDTLTSFLYSVDSTRFSLELPVDSQPREWDKASVVGKAINESWRASDSHLTFGRSLEWALV